MGIFFVAKAGVCNGARYWVPAFAGTTVASFSFQVLVEKWK